MTSALRAIAALERAPAGLSACELAAELYRGRAMPASQEYLAYATVSLARKHLARTADGRTIGKIGRRYILQGAADRVCPAAQRTGIEAAVHG